MDDPARRARYSTVNAALAHLDDDALGRLLADQPATGGWGTRQTVEIAGEPVFVKTIPLTNLEHARMYTTRNHYRLPTYYQYGIGSAGFGAWRELVSHVTTTNWVIEGAEDRFPLTYQFRIVRRASPIDPLDSTDIDDYVRYWNSSKGVARYMTERTNGQYAAAIFLEWLPRSVWDWLAESPNDTERAVRELCNTVSFLREHGIVHFDAHFNNAMTDGERFYLGDFGLLLDPRFDLTMRERAFLDKHAHFDYGGVIYSLGFQLARWYESQPEPERASIRARLGVADDHDDRGLIHPTLVRDVEHLADAVHPALLEAVIRYRDIIEYMAGVLQPAQREPAQEHAVRRREAQEPAPNSRCDRPVSNFYRTCPIPLVGARFWLKEARQGLEQTSSWPGSAVEIGRRPDQPGQEPGRVPEVRS